MNKDSRVLSLFEAISNAVLGFGISMVLTVLLFDVSYSASFITVFIFTVVSILRSYIVRRLFIYLEKRFNHEH